VTSIFHCYLIVYREEQGKGFGSGVPITTLKSLKKGPVGYQRNSLAKQRLKNRGRLIEDYIINQPN